MFGIRQTLPEKVHDLLSVWQIEGSNSFFFSFFLVIGNKINIIDNKKINK